MRVRACREPGRAQTERAGQAHMMKVVRGLTDQRRLRCFEPFFFSFFFRGHARWPRVPEGYPNAKKCCRQVSGWPYKLPENESLPAAASWGKEKNSKAPFAAPLSTTLRGLEVERSHPDARSRDSVAATLWRTRCTSFTCACRCRAAPPPARPTAGVAPGRCRHGQRLLFGHEEWL